MTKWFSVFEGGLEKEKLKRGIGFTLKKFLLGAFLGFQSSDGVDKRGRQSYEMTKSPKGWVDILYLDETMRITKGNRGSVIVAVKK